MVKSARKKRTVAAALAIVFALSFASVSANATSADEFWIESLTLDGGVWIDSNDFSGDDGGWIATSRHWVLLDGDASFNSSNPCAGGVYLYQSDTLEPICTSEGTPNNSDFVYVSDLKSGVAYEVRSGLSGGDRRINFLIPFDAAGKLQRADAIDFDGGSANPVMASGRWVVGNGYGILGLWDVENGEFLIVDFASGDITRYQSVNKNIDFGADDSDPDQGIRVETRRNEGVSGFNASGVLEYRNGEYYFVGWDTNRNISRFSITGSLAREEILVNPLNTASTPGNTKVTDADSFNVSVFSCQWYTHQENGSDRDPLFFQATSAFDEPFVSAEARFNVPCGGPSDTAPSRAESPRKAEVACVPDDDFLAKTGSNASFNRSLIVGAGILLISGAIVVIVASRFRGKRLPGDTASLPE